MFHLSLSIGHVCVYIYLQLVYVLLELRVRVYNGDGYYPDWALSFFVNTIHKYTYYTLCGSDYNYPSWKVENNKIGKLLKPTFLIGYAQLM